MAKQPSRHDRPTEAAWATYLPRLHELYYSQRCTLETARKILLAETGFTASLRMFKARLRPIGVHPKKLTMRQYQAMKVVADAEWRTERNIVFCVPYGAHTSFKTLGQVKKQLQRASKHFQVLEVDAARALLQQSGIAVTQHHLANHHGTDLSTTQSIGLCEAAQYPPPEPSSYGYQ